MKNAGSRVARHLRLAALVAPGSFCVVTPACADTRVGGTVAVDGSVTSNPYLADGGGTDISGALSVSPWLSIADERSSLNVNGNLSARQYNKSANGTDISGNANASGTYAVSGTLSVSGGASYSTSRSGLAFPFASISPTNPLPPPTAPLPDISLIGTRARSQSFSVNAGFGASLSLRDSVSGSFSVSRSSSNSIIGNDYGYLNGQLSYSRTLSETLSVNASIGYGKPNYANRGDGSSVISPQVGMSLRVSEDITVNASVGMSLTRSDLANGATVKSHSLSGSVNFCRSEERGALCFSAARAVQPTAFGATQTVNNIAVSYSTRLSNKDSVSFNMGYNSSGGAANRSAPIGFNTASKLLNLSGSLSHTFSRRISAFASPSFSRVRDFSRSYNSFSISAGLRVSFGAQS